MSVTEGRTDMTMVLDPTSIDDHVARIESDGLHRGRRRHRATSVAGLRDTVRRVERERDVQPLGTQAEGHATLRMYNLLAKDPAFQAMPVHPTMPRHRPSRSSIRAACSRA
jgi:hypothetical protein